MLNVPNKKCIRRLSDRSLKAAKTRNIIAVIAIALTTVLFTSLFTIARPSTILSNSRTSGRRAATCTPRSKT